MVVQRFVELERRQKHAAVAEQQVGLTGDEELKTACWARSMNATGAHI